jgi:hypothetical protein
MIVPYQFAVILVADVLVAAGCGLCHKNNQNSLMLLLRPVTWSQQHCNLHSSVSLPSLAPSSTATFIHWFSGSHHEVGQANPLPTQISMSHVDQQLG